MKTEFGRRYGVELLQDQYSGCYGLFGSSGWERAADHHEVAMWRELPGHLTESFSDEEVDDFVLGVLDALDRVSALDQIAQWLSPKGLSREDVEASLWRLHERHLVRTLLDYDPVRDGADGEAQVLWSPVERNDG